MDNNKRLSKKARLTIDAYGTKWVEKNFVDANLVYADWPLQLNEIIAFQLGSEVGLNIPDLKINANSIQSRFSGIDLFLFENKKLLSSVFSKARNIDQLSKMIAFSHWIGDYDRTVHHTLISEDQSLWFIDFEFCGPRSHKDRYPEYEPDFNDIEHVSCLNCFKKIKPISSRLKTIFPRIGVRFP